MAAQQFNIFFESTVGLHGGCTLHAALSTEGGQSLKLKKLYNLQGDTTRHNS
jgi:hypothetical protein